jgi:DNA gyrase subunit B
LTFFYRQMRELVNLGYVYIAQPPLFRAKRGRHEVFIKDERDLELFLIRRATESRTIVFDSGREISGEPLERRLERLMAFRKLLHVVERRGPARRVILALLEGEARDKSFWTDRQRVDALAGYLNAGAVEAKVLDDHEHQAFAVELTDRSAGYPKVMRIDLDFVTTGEFRTLAAAYPDVRDLMMGAVTIRTSSTTAEPADDGEEEAGAPKAKPVKEPDRRVDSIDELVDYFVAAGRRGVAINRYKGLGEMNPDTLWETTMDPARRTLLQVRADDHTEADLMFTTLMGDQVEPRRRFIEENALDVKNLDI